jgi:uncharacterized protein (TIGR02452 family)
MNISRSKAATLAEQTLVILESGRYKTDAGAVVDMSDTLQHAVNGTRSYPPDHEIASGQPGMKSTQIGVANESTLVSAQKLAAAGHRPVALNFASAKHPGGGFRSGARAQEESLARSSGLYSCLQGNAMYEYHRSLGDSMYSNYAIYSPDVPVFRSDEGTLLEQPFLCSFITSPAVNAKVVLERNPSARSAIREAMRERVRKVLAIAAAHGHKALVLGAWGCGVFGNDCQEIAELFHEALMQPFRGAFARIEFAILDWSEEARFIGPFRTVFGESL